MRRKRRRSIFVNGRRVVPRGGNWGFPEANLRYRGREYDTAMRYHRDMNFTMVRNWVGQTGDDEFYEAADRHGILVWQDFWLANPVGRPGPGRRGPLHEQRPGHPPADPQSPSVALYCGRNEGDPPPALDSRIAAAIAELHPEIHYVPNSHVRLGQGGGPYGVRPREYLLHASGHPQAPQRARDDQRRDPRQPRADDAGGGALADEPALGPARLQPLTATSAPRTSSP